MTIQETIKKAIEGGWRPEYTALPLSHFVNHWHEIVLDPSFWQSLGKGMGNMEVMRCKNYNPRYDEPDEMGCNNDLCEYAGYKDPKRMFDNFMNHIWEGKDAESYFKEL